VYSLIIDDLIILGRACPDRLRNGRITVCTAGYSHKHGFTRIYPTRIDSPLTQWNIVSVPVERSAGDRRKESWKIEGSRSEWPTLSQKIQVVGELKRDKRLNLIANLVDDCVEEIRSEKRSLGIIKPTILKTFFAERTRYDRGIQRTLYGRLPIIAKKNYRFQPRIIYRCSNCMVKTRRHNQQVLEWGVYEWMRKHPEKRNQVWENLRLYSEKHEIFFFVGNLRYRPHRYMIISVLRLPKGKILKPLLPLKKLETEI